MITFYPGPSKIYPSVKQYLQDAFDSGILQMNHRSVAFMELLKNCIETFKEKQNIPTDYQVYFTSSATECWEIVAQSLTQKGSFHCYNGAFGKKWFVYSSRIQDLKFPLVREGKPMPKGAGGCKSFKFGIEEELNFERMSDDFDVICLTQNETSNGTAINSLIHSFTHSLIAIDVTSSLGGIELDWKTGDIWLASVQKCLGLPAGMGIMVASPKALQRAEQIGDRSFYNSLLFIQENFEKYQTHYTPNVLNIYLLWRVMQEVENISIISKKTKQRAKKLYDFIEKETHFTPLINNPSVRSDTVIAIEDSAEKIKKIKQKAIENGIILGNGYGNWKETTFRIANFPAITDSEIQTLQHLLTNEL